MKVKSGVAADWLTCRPNENRAQSVLVPHLSDTPCVWCLKNSTSRVVEQTRSSSKKKRGLQYAARQKTISGRRLMPPLRWWGRSYGCSEKMLAERQYTGMDDVGLGVGCHDMTSRQLVGPEGSSHPSRAILIT